MRERLLDATLDVIYDLGYAGATTIEIVSRAGVSRGAMLHHFPSRAELFVAAAEHVAAVRLAEFRDTLASLPSGAGRFDAAIDLLWKNFTSPSFYAMLDLTAAARTDQELRDKLADAADRFDGTLSATTEELFGDMAPAAEMVQAGRRFLYFLMQGMATNRIVSHSDREAQQVLDILKQFFPVAAEFSARLQAAE